ncbi:hypothetical protein [Streptomyces sp. NPDC051219]|uniref:hypothetical protein n=1 Tax=Streptomyces sp. NPDC051219 TaxID=3155283 RepID=UPI003427251A
MRPTALAALCLAAAVGLTACGTTKKDSDSGKSSGSASQKENKEQKKEPFADLSGPQIVEQAVEATRTATSLRLKGDTVDKDGRMVLDMALNTKDECAGSMSMDQEGSLNLIKTGETVYIKFDEKFLRSQSEGEPKEETDAAVAMLANRWMQTKTSEPDAKEFTGVCDLNEVLKEFEDVNSVARKGAVTTVDGQEAITLTETDGKETHTLYVATQGEPYLLKVVSQGGDEPGAMSFTDYNKPVPAEAPADKDVVDLAELAG